MDVGYTCLHRHSYQSRLDQPRFLCVPRMSSDVNVVSLAQCKFRVIRARTGSAIPFESAQVIFAGDGAHLCTLPLHGARIY